MYKEYVILSKLVKDNEKNFNYWKQFFWWIRFY